eukprot:364790-Chlamydomonas_euryale.AAC.15
MVHPAALRASGMAGQATRSRILCPHAPMDQPSTSARGGAPVAIGRVRRRCDRLLCRHKIHEFSLWRGELPSPPGLDTPGAVAGAATRATPLLTPQRVRAHVPGLSTGAIDMTGDMAGRPTPALELQAARQRQDRNVSGLGWLEARSARAAAACTRRRRRRRPLERGSTCGVSE